MDSFAPIDPDLLDVEMPQHDGYPVEFEAGDTTDAVKDAAGAAAREFPDSMWIEPEDWPDAAREADKYRVWPLNYMDRFTNQDPSHECTCHSLTRCMESARNRSIGVKFPDGPKRDYRYDESDDYGSVWLSPLSVYAEANPGQWGGANVREVMEIACRRGALPDIVQPRDYNFIHAIHGTTGAGNINQSSGPWTRVSSFPNGWETTARWFRPLEVIFPESWEQCMCCVLQGMAVGVGRKGHAVPWSFLKFEGTRLVAAGYADSYDIVRFDSLVTIKAAWRGAFAIASMTSPDDWLRSAG